MYQKHLNEIQDESQHTIQDLKTRLMAAEKLCQQLQDDPKKRQLLRENEELQLTVEKLTEELKELGKQKADIVAAKEEASLIHQKQFVELLAKCKNAENEVERLSGKVK